LKRKRNWPERKKAVPQRNLRKGKKEDSGSTQGKQQRNVKTRRRFGWGESLKKETRRRILKEIRMGFWTGRSNPNGKKQGLLKTEQKGKTPREKGERKEGNLQGGGATWGCKTEKKKKKKNRGTNWGPLC